MVVDNNAVGDYIIKEITAKEGSLRQLHHDAMGTECFIVDLEKGQRSLLRYKPEYDNRYHRLHTSTVLGIKTSDGENDVVIETLNTVYHLIRNNFDDTFSGINSYTYEVAKETVTGYLNEQDDSYFEKYGITKEAALENDDLISQCAFLHHSLIKEAGLDYAWACDFACSHGLSNTLAFAQAD